MRRLPGLDGSPTIRPRSNFPQVRCGALEIAHEPDVRTLNGQTQPARVPTEAPTRAAPTDGRQSPHQAERDDASPTDLDASERRCTHERRRQWLSVHPVAQRIRNVQPLGRRRALRVLFERRLWRVNPLYLEALLVAPPLPCPWLRQGAVASAKAANIGMVRWSMLSLRWDGLHTGAHRRRGNTCALVQNRQGSRPDTLCGIVRHGGTSILRAKFGSLVTRGQRSGRPVDLYHRHPLGHWRSGNPWVSMRGTDGDDVARVLSSIPGSRVWTCLGALALVSSSAEWSHAKRPAPSSGQSSPSKADCIQAHKRCQQAQNDRRLVEARAWATSCTNPACPGLLVADCARWLNELDQRIPSVVFDVRAGGHPGMKAEAYADGERVENWTRGEALRLDPGQHTFRFVLAPFSPATETVLLAEGMRFRVVAVDLAMLDQKRSTPSQGKPVPEPDRAAGTARPVPVVVYPLLGVGVAGIAGFIGFGLSGRAEQRRLERTCSPNCIDSDLSTMRQRYLIGDISAAVGFGAMLGAGVLYLFRPKRPTRESVSVTALPGGGSMALAAYRF
jgi:hypothetical protein